MSQYLDKDGASRIAENFLSKQAEQDAILRNLQFDLKEAEHALVKTIQGPAPLNIRALTRPLDDYLISGSTVQNGTPTPDNPVDVVGCGEKTENLYPFPYTTNLGLSGSGQNRTVNTMAYQGSSIVKLEPNTAYYMFGDRSASQDVNGVIAIFDELPKVGSVSTHFYYYNSTTQAGVEFTTDATETYGLVVHRSSTDYTTDYHMMLNTGSAPLPYEPYGYKLTPTVNGTEYPIYFGQVPTTRRIRKLVLTGDEDWNLSTINTHGIANFWFRISDRVRGSDGIGYCSHYEKQTASGADATTEGFFSGVTDALYIRVQSTTADTVEKFKDYISGKGVTIWYTLAEPETGIVNEPLHKIGDYADTISMTQAGVTLTTTKGFNTITTDTTVLPSNIEVKGVINNA